MISVSFVYARRASGDGLRAPPRTLLPSPNAPANGATSSATSSALARIQGPLARTLSALRMRDRIECFLLFGGLPMRPNRAPTAKVAVTARSARRWSDGGQREQRPVPRDAVERLHAALLEPQSRAYYGPVRRARGQHLAGSRQRGDARGDVDGHAADVVADDLALAGVQADPDLQPHRPNGLDDGLRTAHRLRRRAVEGDEEGVADGLDLAPAEAVDLAAHGGLVSAEQVAPARVAPARPPRRRPPGRPGGPAAPTMSMKMTVSRSRARGRERPPVRNSSISPS